MGVKGLWKLLESSGKNIQLEELSGQKVAIDISVWLHRLSKGLRDTKGEPLLDAHLHGVFRRLCKLLFFGIKPVFIFDGKVSSLKYETIMKRQRRRQEAEKNASKLRKEVIKKMLQKEAFKVVFGDLGTNDSIDSSDRDKKKLLNGYNEDDDPYLLPEKTLNIEEIEEDSEEDNDDDDIYCSMKNQIMVNKFLKNGDETETSKPHSFDENISKVYDIKGYESSPELMKTVVSNIFNPASVLKRNPEYSLDNMPEDSDDFSNFQLGRLLSGKLRKRKSFELSNEGCQYENQDASNDLVDCQLFSSDKMRFVLAKRKKQDDLNCSEITEKMKGKDLKVEPTEHKPDTLENGRDHDKSRWINRLSTNWNEPLTEEAYFGYIKNKMSDKFVDKTVRKTKINFEEILSKSNKNDKELVSDKNVSALINEKSEEDDDDDNSFVVVTESIQFSTYPTTTIASSQTTPTFFKTNTKSTEENSATTKVYNKTALIQPTLQKEAKVSEISDYKTPEEVAKKSEPTDDSIKSLVDEIIQPLSSGNVKLNTSQGKLKEVDQKLQAGLESAVAEKGKEERKGVSITQKMCLEVQHLLELFGVPYKEAPEEAESQCAYLNSTNQVDAVMTEDSDALLFGARKVLKDVFSGRKTATLYQAASIERKIGLGRRSIVCIGMLSGCDYTEGVDRVGPSTAVKIIKEFKRAKDSKNKRMNSSEDTEFNSLVRFKDWWRQNKEQGTNNKSPLKNSLAKLQLSEDFPSRIVYDAFMTPFVDSTTHHFTWKSPDLPALKKYASTVLKWSEQNIRNMIQPLEKVLQPK